MPLDLRKTYFSLDEVSSALVQYCVRKKIDHPETKINNVKVEWTPNFKVSLFFSPEMPDAKEAPVLRFERNEVAAALILYCHNNNEPIPHHAEKGIEPTPDGLVLMLRFPWGPEWDVEHPAFRLSWPSFD